MTNNLFKKLHISMSLLVFGVLVASCHSNKLPSSLAGYRGTPFKDSLFAGPISLPGKLECEFIDFGGEGVAYHDADSINSGSGWLNPANGAYLNEFRQNEGFDISYTKSGDTDNSGFNVVMPALKSLYIGWTEPSEWYNYTVDVKKSGKYNLSIWYTSNKGGEFSLTVDKSKVLGSYTLPSTFNANDTVPWRQWHHWNHIDTLGVADLEEGLHLITLKIEENGNMNFDNIAFEL